MMDDAVAVRLTPPQAKHIAASMRIALAARLEGAWPDPFRTARTSRGCGACELLRRRGHAGVG